MKFIIKNVNSNTYMYTRQLEVCNSEFARRFNSAKQAKAYAGSSYFRNGKYILVSVGDNIGNMTDIVTIKEKVLDTNLKNDCIKALKLDSE